MSSFMTYIPPSIWTATSIGPAAAVTQSSTTGAVVPMQTSTDLGDKKVILNCSNSGTRAPTAAEGDPSITTDDTLSTEDGTAACPASSTDSTAERVTTESDLEAPPSSSSTVGDPAAALSTLSRTNAMTPLPTPDSGLNGPTTPRKAIAVTETELKSEVMGPTWERLKTLTQSVVLLTDICSKKIFLSEAHPHTP